MRYAPRIVQHLSLESLHLLALVISAYRLAVRISLGSIPRMSTRQIRGVRDITTCAHTDRVA